MAGALPLNATKVGFTPRTELRKRPRVNVTEPAPACAMFSFSVFAFHVGREFLQVFRGKVLPCRDEDWLLDDHANWLEIDIRLVGKVGVKRNREGMSA